MENETGDEKQALEVLIKNGYDEVDTIDTQIKTLQKTRQSIMKDIRANTSKLVTIELKGK